MALRIEEYRQLGPYTTLGVGGPARYYADVCTESDLREACAFAEARALPVVVLGGGSNVVCADHGVDALVVHPCFRDQVYTLVSGDVTEVTVGAGVPLDTLIEETVERGLWGLENLSAIPGTIGAVPIQNVGAYGVEAKDVVIRVDAYDVRTGEVRVFSKEACMFDYRTSFFKSNEGKSYIVTSVTFALSVNPRPQIGYRDLAMWFGDEKMPSQRSIRSAVTEIRSKKFPDWHTLGTAGSFFKNPIIPRDQFELLVTRYPELPGFPHNGMVKVPLGWILDRILNVRGYRKGNVGLYEAQALVLVQYGNATATEIREFSDDIIEKIFEATHIRVEREVQFM